METLQIRKLKTYEYGISGMRCTNCSSNIEKNVRGLSSV